MDWNQDGKLDILSGCYRIDGKGGQIQILIGRGGNNFEESVSLENVAGKPLENVEDPEGIEAVIKAICTCLLYTSPSPRDGLLSRMPSSA